ncbi:hypothetical protein ACSS6W_009847 [Trichoderma asperelloides]|uniref:Uncharacterized protein n=1 Tax=Trichoderma asperellum TaxID=101201 RepID=A0A6V8R3J8_TRIAP|nr:hypothetical protein TASIC1_0014004600 [Trichoderma asperellum]
MFLKSILLAITVSLASAQIPRPEHSQVGRACGFKIAPCPFDMKCVPNNPYCSELNRCPGHCEFKNQYQSCGGFTPRPHNCGGNSECQDDPRLPPNCGLACDVPGICIPKETHFCGGFIGLSCPEGLFCYDALDGCDPLHGGADCGGICL